jgi:hypothetical protein
VVQAPWLLAFPASAVLVHTAECATAQVPCPPAVRRRPSRTDRTLRLAWPRRAAPGPPASLSWCFCVRPPAPHHFASRRRYLPPSVPLHAHAHTRTHALTRGTHSHCDAPRPPASLQSAAGVMYGNPHICAQNPIGRDRPDTSPPPPEHCSCVCSCVWLPSQPRRTHQGLSLLPPYLPHIRGRVPPDSRIRFLSPPPPLRAFEYSLRPGAASSPRHPRAAARKSPSGCTWHKRAAQPPAGGCVDLVEPNAKFMRTS